MVFVQYKKSEKNHFTIEVPGSILVEVLLAKLIEINNLRLYLDRLIWSIEELANKGVLRPPQLQGVSYEEFQKNIHQFKSLSQEKLVYARKPSIKHPNKYVSDKYFQRHGVVLAQDQKKILLNAVEKGREVMKPKKETTKVQQLVETVDTLRNAVMDVYPAYIGLPEWEPTLLLLEEKLQLEVLESQSFELFDLKGTVWWAGKELEKKKTVRDYAGQNQKTKIIVKVQKYGGEQPPREPPIDVQTYNKMVKFYYKKVEENKQFDQKAVEQHYEKVQGENMKEKLYLQDSLRFRPF